MMVKQSYKLPVLISVLLHLVILALLFMHFSVKPTQIASDVKIIEAVTIEEKQLQSAPPMPPTPSQPIKPAVAQNTIRHIEQKTLKQPADDASPPKIPVPSPQTLEEPVQKALPLPDTKALAAQKLALAKKTQEEQKRKEKELKKKRREAEVKRLQQEMAKEAKQVAIAKVAHEEVTAEEETDSEVTEKINEEQNQISAAKASAAASEIDHYKQIIIQAISRKWVVTQDHPDLVCKLIVHLGPGGIVMDVDIVQESGDSNLDRSARAAILKASPLPVPENPEVFDKFRTLRLTFRPQGIISE